MEIIDDNLQSELEKGNEIAISEQKHEVSNPFENSDSFGKLWDIGKMFATSKIIPANFQGKAMDCCIAVDMANRMGVSPIMVMQNLYVVQGKPSWSGQACKTLITGSGKFKRVKHRYIGEPNTDNWGCYLEAVRLEDGETVKGPTVTIAMAKAEGWYNKNGSKWKTLPELMLAYRASAFFARVHVPESLMGIAVEGDVEDVSKNKTVTADNPLGIGGTENAVK